MARDDPDPATASDAPRLEIGAAMAPFLLPKPPATFGTLSVLMSVGLHACFIGAVMRWSADPPPAPALLEIPVEIVIEPSEAPPPETVASSEPADPTKTEAPPEAPPAEEAEPTASAPAVDATPPTSEAARETPQPPEAALEANDATEARPQIATPPPQAARAEPVAADDAPPVDPTPPPAPQTPAQLSADQRAIAAFVHKLRQALERNKRYPRSVSDQGAAIVTFVVDRAGRVSRLELAKSTGNTALDAAALDMVRRSEPLPPLPPEIQRDDMTVTLPVNFLQSRRRS